MTTKEILETAIQKAIDGGWLTVKTKPRLKAVVFEDVYDDWGDYASYIIIDLRNRKPVQFESVESIIFNHDFAKALWPATVEIDTEPEYAEGDQEIGGIPWNTHETVEAWSYHLQQMVLAEDPIKYLGENI